MPRFKSIIFFYQNSPKIKLFLQKNAKFSSPKTQDPKAAPHCEFLATHLAQIIELLLVLAYIWQKDVAKIFKVPGAPRNTNPARE